MNPPIPQITSASVKVMRSFDYCHFEVVLGHAGTLEESSITPEQIDNLRKEAARLADKAVAQYKIAKGAAEAKLSAQNEKSSAWTIRRVEVIRAKSEQDRSVEEKAELKAYEDACFRANRQDYDYQDDWQEEDDQD